MKRLSSSYYRIEPKRYSSQKYILDVKWKNEFVDDKIRGRIRKKITKHLVQTSLSIMMLTQPFFLTNENENKS